MLKMCEESLRLYVEGVERRVGKEKLRLLCDVKQWSAGDLGRLLIEEWEEGAGGRDTARDIEEYLRRVVN